MEHIPSSVVRAMDVDTHGPDNHVAVPIYDAGRLLALFFVDQSEALQTLMSDRSRVAQATTQMKQALGLLGSEQARTFCLTQEAGNEQKPLHVRFHARDGSVLVGTEYVTRGVAGAMLWSVLRTYAATGEREFSYKQLRMDSSLRLPASSADNLPTRLLLLRNRLEERCPRLRIEKKSRGRFELVVDGPVTLTLV